MSLSVLLPGSTMFSKEESLKQLKKPVKNKAGKVIKKQGEPVVKTVLVPDFDKNDSFTLELKERGKVSFQAKVFVRKSRPAKQVINLSEEAYQNMISPVAPPEFKGTWSALTKNQKLKWHCNRIAQQLGGEVESFQILD